MMALNIVNGKMSTLQFAELTGDRHDNVLVKARKLMIDTDGSNRQSPMLSLDRDLSLTLAGQYEPKIAYHVAKSFFAATPDPKLSISQMLLIAGEELENKELALKTVRWLQINHHNKEGIRK